MNKKFLLFDADRTLLDFSASEKKALAQTFREYDLPFSEEAYQYHLVNNAKLWSDYEKGLIDRQAVLNTRFVKLCQHFGFHADGVAFEGSYRRNLNHCCDVMEDAMEVVQRLSEEYQLYIITNGVASTQESRIRDSGLRPYFKDVFISEEIGYQKPLKAYFDCCFAKIPAFDPALALVIGDSLSSDIQGGNNAGVETCWFNPSGEKNHTSAHVDYEIRSLKELYVLLAKA